MPNNEKEVQNGTSSKAEVSNPWPAGHGKVLSGPHVFFS